MTIVNIKNGLGNQLFQYAFGKVLEWKYNTQVYFDLLRDEIKSPLQTDLDVFCIEPIVEVNPKIANRFKPFSVRQYRDNKQFVKYIYYKLRRKYQPHKLITEPYPSQFMEVFENLNTEKSIYFLGFWQNYKYYVGYEDRIRKLFEPKDKSFWQTEQAIEIKNNPLTTVSLHFRRGDYLTSGFIVPTTMEYYKLAIDKIQSCVDNPIYYVFTDEPEWFEQNIELDIPYKLITGNTDKNCYKDILLMSLCQHNIMANSTFSWWGAFLNTNSDKIVIAPKTWYGTPNRDLHTNEITPPEWYRL